MNKLVKGSIAGAAGIALLLGGAGTFALWNDSAVVNAGTVTTGELKIVANATPAAVWTEQSLTGARNGVVGSTIDVSTVKMVPGDTWRYTKTLTLTTTGKNLLADLTFDPASIVAATGIPASELDYKFVAAAPTPVVATNATVVQSTTNTNVYRVTPGTGSTTTVTVTLDITFKDIASPTNNNNTGQNKTIDVSGLKLTLNQVRV